jgi:hypothetical protein
VREDRRDGEREHPIVGTLHAQTRSQVTATETVPTKPRPSTPQNATVCHPSATVAHGQRRPNTTLCHTATVAQPSRAGQSRPVGRRPTTRGARSDCQACTNRSSRHMFRRLRRGPPRFNAPKCNSLQQSSRRVARARTTECDTLARRNDRRATPDPGANTQPGARASSRRQAGGGFRVRVPRYRSVQQGACCQCVVRLWAVPSDAELPIAVRSMHQCNRTMDPANAAPTMPSPPRPTMQQSATLQPAWCTTWDPRMPQFATPRRRCRSRWPVQPPITLPAAIRALKRNAKCKSRDRVAPARASSPGRFGNGVRNKMQHCATHSRRVARRPAAVNRSEHLCVLHQPLNS